MTYRLHYSFNQGKNFSKASFQLRMELKKDRNKAETKERKTTTRYLQNTQQVGSPLAFFHLCCASVRFSAPSSTKMKFKRTFFPSLRFLQGFYTTFQIKDERVYCAADEHMWSQGRTRIALVRNAFVLEVNAFKLQYPPNPPSPHTQTHTNTHTQLAPSDFQTKHIMYFDDVFVCVCYIFR